MNPALPPLGLYVHLPWCVRKCPYCDFNSHAAGEEPLPEREYTGALLHDLEGEHRHSSGRSLHSIFIGGGTPSLFSAPAIGRLLDGIARQMSCAPELEISLEANPGVAEQRHFAGFRSAGVNRLSIGVQSFDDRKLQSLGRIHDGDAARRAVVAARAAGFEQLNLDLMHGLPGQTAAEAAADLRQAIALEPTQVSWYQLSIEKNTAFYRHPPELPAENVLAEIQARGERLLQEAGYRQYEVSAWSLPGGECRHNLNYWRFGDYLGIGAGAHGKCSELYDKYTVPVAKMHVFADNHTLPENPGEAEKHSIKKRKNINMQINADKSSIPEHPRERRPYSATKTAKCAEFQGMSPIRIVRTEKSRLPRRYLEHFQNGVPATGGGRQWTPGEEERPLEFMMNVLRLKRGCESTLFEARTGVPLERIAPVLQGLRDDGLLRPEPGRICASALGHRFLDEVLQAFVPGPEPAGTPYIISSTQPGARSSVG